MIPSRIRSVLAVLAVALLAVLVAPLAADAALPDAMTYGPHPVTSMDVSPGFPGSPGDPSQAKLGLASLEEPNGTGGSTTPSAAPNAANAVTLQVRGALYYPSDISSPAPLIMLVHGNHGSCHVSGPAGSGANCTTFNRNDLGYAYLAKNLASWGYVVFSLDQDQLIFYQDGSYGKGMHQRRLLMAAALDGLYQANQPGGLPLDANDNLGTQLVGKIDFNRIGLMGHSRGGDAVTSFLDYNRTRPAPGRRYTIRGVIALAPTDYERRAPYGVAYGTMIGACDGDVSNLMGTRFFSRSLHSNPNDPFPRIQMILQGANHDAFNSEWDADGDDATTDDPACGQNAFTNPFNSTPTPLDTGSIRLTRGPYQWVGPAPYAGSNFYSADLALEGDQERAGEAMMAEFFRRYVGGETGFDPYMTGEATADGTTPALPASACPTAKSGPLSCFDRLSTSYFAAPQEREDVIDPDPDNPLTVSALGTSLKASGFDYPYENSPGVFTKPAVTDSGLDWCNPEPDQFTPSQVGIPETYPTANRPCPLPAVNDAGGQGKQTINFPPGTTISPTGGPTQRENAPVNHSYENQLAIAWDHPLDSAAAAPAELSTRIPAADGDVSDLKALAFHTAVNYWDPRNPTRSYTNPNVGKQNFTVTLTDAAGHTGTIQAGDPKYGFGLQPSLGGVTTRLHVILQQIRVPLSVFAAQGVDTTSLRKIAFDFGGTGMPQSGSIQLADVRFQESTSGPTVFADSPGANGPAAASTKVEADNASAEQIIADTPREPASSADPDVSWLQGGGTAALPTTAAAAPCLPTATVSSIRRTHGRLAIRGRAAACASGAGDKLVAVHVALSKSVAGGCRFVTASGKLGARVSCTTPVYLVPKHTARWSLGFRHALRSGRYTLTARAVTAAGTQTAAKARAIRVR